MRGSSHTDSSLSRFKPLPVRILFCSVSRSTNETAWMNVKCNVEQLVH